MTELRRARKQRKWTQSQLAAKLKPPSTGPTISRWELLQGKPPIYRINQLADLLPVSADVLAQEFGLDISPTGEEILDKTFVKQLLTLTPKQLDLIRDIVVELLEGDPGRGGRT